jgi:hypothetical protein
VGRLHQVRPLAAGRCVAGVPVSGPRRTASQRGLSVINGDPQYGGRWVAFIAGLAIRCHSLAEARGLRHYGEQPTVRRWSRRWL